MSELLKVRLAPFRNRNFRNFFFAQTLSMVGTWSHDLARSWIIVEATGSSGALGNLNMAIAVPCLFLILQGGVLVDKTDVRRLILHTKSLMAISALILAALAEFSHLEVWQLMIFGLIEGFIVAFDSPAFQALTVRMVPRHDFQQAIALNSTNFHTSRMLGPVVAAWLMALHGPSLVFLFDGITYLMVAFVLTRTSLFEIQLNKKSLQDSSLGHGLRYIWGQHVLRFRVMQLMLAITCVFPIMATVFRVFVQQKFDLGAQEFGMVFTFPALGSMSGALIFAIVKPRQPTRAMLVGVPLVFIGLNLVPWMNNLPLTVAAMSLTGFGLYLTFASLTVSMQLDVKEEYRGRLSSVIGMGFSAIGPLMCFPWGHLADYIGPPTTIVACAFLFGSLSGVLAIAYHRSLSKSSKMN